MPKHFQHAENEAIKTLESEKIAIDLLQKVSQFSFSRKRKVIFWARVTFAIFSKNRLSVSRTALRSFHVFSNKLDELHAYKALIQTIHLFLNYDSKS